MRARIIGTRPQHWQDGHCQKTVSWVFFPNAEGITPRHRAALRPHLED